MNKSVIATFTDPQAGQRAINDLKANGFAGENITHAIRENLPPEAPQGPQPLPVMEVAKDVAIGAVAGAILGALADWVAGMSLTWPSYSFNHHLPAAVLTLAVAGAIVGLLNGLAAVGSLEPARRALLMHRSEDALVLVSTDETHASQAMDLLRAAGARDVRRGAASVPGEYRMAEGVRPEAYGTTEPGSAGEVRPVTRETVSPEPTAVVLPPPPES